MTLESLLEAISYETEWMETTDGDEHNVISIENLEGLLSRYFEKTIKIPYDRD